MCFNSDKLMYEILTHRADRFDLKAQLDGLECATEVLHVPAGVDADA